MRILVTGAAGFIGSEFVRTLLGAGYPGLDAASVTVLDALTYAGRRENLAPVANDPRFAFVHGDICDAPLLAEVVPGHDLVINFAAESHVDRSIDGPAAFMRSNALGAQTVFEACLRAGVPRVIQVSTDEVYGSIDEGAWTEEWPLSPNSPYSASKASADLMAFAYHRTYSLNVSVTRCSNNYGPYQFPEKLLPLFITNLIDGLPVPLYGDGLNVREWIHVADHCRGIALVAASGAAGEAYNIGGGTELTNRDITQRLLDAFGVGWDVVRQVPDRLGHDRRYAIDDTKLRGLGYAPQIGFEQGLADVITWYRNNEAWWRPLKG